MVMNVKMPRTISSSVWLPITRLANEVAYSLVSPGTGYIDRPKMMAHCHGPMPPFDGTPIEMEVSTKHTSTAVQP